MKKKVLKQRASAVQRYIAGESPQSICASLGKTKPWLYKWVARHTPDDPAWCEDQSRRPLSSPCRTPAEIEKIVDLFFGEIIQRLADGGRVELRGFGAFSTRDRSPRQGRNPRTGASVEVPSKRVPYFKPGKEVRERLNT